MVCLVLFYCSCVYFGVIILIAIAFLSLISYFVLLPVSGLIGADVQANTVKPSGFPTDCFPDCKFTEPADTVDGQTSSPVGSLGGFCIPVFMGLHPSQQIRFGFGLSTAQSVPPVLCAILCSRLRSMRCSSPGKTRRT